jgi:acrylyl-CoA reductase (NADPH)
MPNGCVASCGNAASGDLQLTVYPFILRGVTLAGIESVNCPMPRREKAWARLARDLDMTKLADGLKTVRLEDVLTLGSQILKGQVKGRIIVDVQR